MEDQAPNGFGRADWCAAAVTFAVALGVRLLFLFTWADRAWPHSLWYEGDAPLWDQWARALASGGTFEHGLAIHAPGAAYTLYALGFGGSPDYTGAKVLWCAASAAGCAMTFVVVAREFGRRVGLLAAGLATFAFASYVQAVSLNVEALYTPLLVASVGLTGRLARAPGWGPAALLGAVHAAATMLRAEHVLTAAALALPVALRWRREWGAAPHVRRAGYAALVVLVAAALCMPWMLHGRAAAHRMNTVVAEPVDFGGAQWSEDGRQYIESLPAFARRDNAAYLSHLASAEGGGLITRERARALLLREFGSEPAPLPERLQVSSQGPMVFALGNYPGGTGGFRKSALDARFNPDPTLNLALPTHNNLYVHGYALGWEWITADPAGWARLAALKLAIFADGATQGLTAANLPVGRVGVRRAVDQFTASRTWRSAAWTAVLGAFMLAGLIRAARALRGGAWVLVIAAKVLVCVLFIGYARQSASILPAFAVFAALGVDGVLRAAGRAGVPGRAWPPLGAACVLLALASDGATFARFASLGRASEPRPSIDGPVRIEQKWGGEAFVCPADMGLRASGSPP